MNDTAKIEVEVRPCSPAERRGLVEARLRLTPERSDRAIAEGLGVSKVVVAQARRRLESSGEIPSAPGRVGRDGRSQPAARPKRWKPLHLSAEQVADRQVVRLARKIRELTVRTEFDDFAESYCGASAEATGQLQLAVLKLAARADRLRKLGTAEGGPS